MANIMSGELSALIFSAFADVARGFIEFLLLVIFAHERFYHADAADVFLYGIVERVVLFEDAAEQRQRFAHDKEQSEHEDGQKHHVNQREFCGNRAAYHDGENKHQGHADNDTQAHLKRHLHVGYVGG